MFKYELTIRYRWEEVYRVCYGEPKPVTVYANSQDEALSKALAQSGSMGLEVGEWVLASVVSVEEIPEMVDPDELLRAVDEVKKLDMENFNLREELKFRDRNRGVYPHIDRVCVVSEGGGREFDARDLFEHGVQVNIQDDGKTMKLLPLSPKEVPF